MTRNVEKTLRSEVEPSPVFFVNDSRKAFTKGSIDLTLAVVFGEKFLLPPSSPNP